MRDIIILVGAVALLWGVFTYHAPARWSGQLAPRDPVQIDEDLPPPWRVGKNTITPRARYSLTAVVLSKHHYWAGAEEDKLAPYDLALGWGGMSDAAVINALKIAQYARWYNYSWKGEPPMDPVEIGRYSSNNHIIAADGAVAGRVRSIKRHDVVSLKGYLVDVSRSDGWHWETSLSRGDTAGGSCELFWVESAEISSRP